jgi:hypothetical protein
MRTQYPQRNSQITSFQILHFITILALYRLWRRKQPDLQLLVEKIRQTNKLVVHNNSFLYWNLRFCNNEKEMCKKQKKNKQGDLRNNSLFSLYYQLCDST